MDTLETTKSEDVNTEPTKTEEVNISKIVGYILLSPALVSVLLFFIALLFSQDTLYNVGKFDSWAGDYGGDGGGFTSALPLYFGLMAIAGAYLIKDKK